MLSHTGVFIAAVVIGWWPGNLLALDSLASGLTSFRRASRLANVHLYIVAKFLICYAKD